QICVRVGCLLAGDEELAEVGLAVGNRPSDHSDGGVVLRRALAEAVVLLAVDEVRADHPIRRVDPVGVPCGVHHEVAVVALEAASGQVGLGWEHERANKGGGTDTGYGRSTS